MLFYVEVCVRMYKIGMNIIKINIYIYTYYRACTIILLYNFNQPWYIFSDIVIRLFYDKQLFLEDIKISKPRFMFTSKVVINAIVIHLYQQIS